jgi:hypothetical protein
MTFQVSHYSFREKNFEFEKKNYLQSSECSDIASRRTSQVYVVHPGRNRPVFKCAESRTVSDTTSAYQRRSASPAIHIPATSYVCGRSVVISAPDPPGLGGFEIWAHPSNSHHSKVADRQVRLPHMMH